MSETKPTLEEILEVAQAGARMVGEQFTDPEADWNPMAFLALPHPDKTGSTVVTVMDMSEWMGDKEDAAHKIATLAKAGQAFLFAMVASSWMVDVKTSSSTKGLSPGEVLGGVMPSQHPDRQEVLLVHGLSHDREEMIVARIHRHADRPPTLGKFEDMATAMGEKSKGVSKGLWIDVVQPALAVT